MSGKLARPPARQSKVSNAMPPPLEALETLPPEQRLAIAWSTAEARDRLTSMLAFDGRLARIVTRTREPMLGQMRLAWWRDRQGAVMAEFALVAPIVFSTSAIPSISSVQLPSTGASTMSIWPSCLSCPAFNV